MKIFVVTGVPPAAQKEAAGRGFVNYLRRKSENKSWRNKIPHKAVRGQVGLVICGRKEADDYATDLKAKGYIVTLRRWRPRR